MDGRQRQLAGFAHICAVLATLPFVASLHAEPADARHSTGPFLGNGSRNSWADQTSIVIWTRTTRAPDMVADGPSFVAVSKKEAATLGPRATRSTPP